MVRYIPVELTDIEATSSMSFIQYIIMTLSVILNIETVNFCKQKTVLCILPSGVNVNTYIINEISSTFSGI